MKTDLPSIKTNYPYQGTFEGDFPLSKMGYVSFLEDSTSIYQLIFQKKIINTTLYNTDAQCMAFNYMTTPGQLLYR